MVDPAAVRRLAAALPNVEDRSSEQSLSFCVPGGKGFAWTYQARIAPKAPRRPRLDFLAVRCVPEEKDTLLELDPAKFFDDDHYRGYPAVLVRLDQVDEAELMGLLATALRCVAAKRPRPAARRQEAGLGAEARERPRPPGPAHDVSVAARACSA